MIQEHCTAGELASILGISERRVAALKAEKRIPTSAEGKVLVRDLLEQLYRENAAYRLKAASVGGSSKVTAPQAWNERYPADAMAGAAMNILAHLIPDAVERVALEAGIAPATAARLREAARGEAAQAISDTVGLCGILRDPDGPEPLIETHNDVSAALQASLGRTAK